MTFTEIHRIRGSLELEGSSEGHLIQSPCTEHYTYIRLLIGWKWKEFMRVLISVLKYHYQIFYLTFDCGKSDWMPLKKCVRFWTPDWVTTVTLRQTDFISLKREEMKWKCWCLWNRYFIFEKLFCSLSGIPWAFIRTWWLLTFFDFFFWLAGAPFFQHSIFDFSSSAMVSEFLTGKTVI